jgi:hypothetical protein
MIGHGSGALEIFRMTILFPSKVVSALWVGSQNEYSRVCSLRDDRNVTFL